MILNLLFAKSSSPSLSYNEVHCCVSRIGEITGFILTFLRVGSPIVYKYRLVMRAIVLNICPREFG